MNLAQSKCKVRVKWALAIANLPTITALHLQFIQILTTVMKRLTLMMCINRITEQNQTGIFMTIAH